MFFHRFSIWRCLVRNTILIPLALTVFGIGCANQTVQPAVTAADYARAESFLAANTTPLVMNVMGSPTWLDDGRLIYRNTIDKGHEFIVADPVAKTRKPAFDHKRLAESLSKITGETVEPFDLPFTQFEFTEDGPAIQFTVLRQRYQCNLRTYQCTETTQEQSSGNRNAVISPDGLKAAFIRDYNLWVQDIETDEETQLTTDGVEDFGYATNNAGWTKSDRPVLLWSPDSTKIATFQHDGRGVGEMYLVSTEVGHPKLSAWKYPLPGDEHIFRLHRIVIHLDEPRVVRLQMPPDAHRSTISDHVASGTTWLDVEWSEDSTKLAFVSSSRDHKEAKLRIADPLTGTVRDIMEEKVDTFFESGNDKVNWHILAETNQTIWFSQRDNWGHLYMYDLETGRLKHQITKGNWNVLQLLRIDKENRMLYFTGSCREPGDPYFEYFYRVQMDRGTVELLTPENANHAVSLSPSGDYFVDSYSTPTEPVVSVLRAANGEKLVVLEKADISKLKDHGWVPPIPIKLKARDGETDIYGLMYKPTNFDASKKYPILNYLYPGPQSGSVGSRSFRASRSDKQSLAELGFIVVEVDAMGSPGRSKSFHEFYYGNMGDNGIPDQMAAIRQLAKMYDWMNLDKVGIWGHSGGGFASTDAILRYPEFYQVAVSGAGNHDNRNYEDDWGEKWQGLLIENPDGTTNYDNQANQLLAENLQGKLLIAHGTMDSNVPPYNTLVVVDALIAANKDFDLLLLPNRGHGFSSEPYMMRRRWDYFVRHLQEVEPPKEYEFNTDTRRR
ncbi:MAG: prolyl oligopeptidase family serine peptidase [Planctomycetes bacterium]|nr:prolyl oligopeptidase family serine peptidase [Planctomycetota bacterium]